MEELKQKLIDLKQALPIISQLGGLDKSALKTITEELDQALFLYNVSNMLTVKEVLDILDDSDHLDDAKTLIRETVS
tara:strand:- start:3476 stop:3706 length:231 start_codon:yes stop_codon:yes gene_type:complete